MTRNEQPSLNRLMMNQGTPQDPSRRARVEAARKLWQKSRAWLAQRRAGKQNGTDKSRPVARRPCPQG